MGVNTLVEIFRSQSLTLPEQVGEKRSVGTNCDLYIPEIREIIQKEHKNNTYNSKA